MNASISASGLMFAAFSRLDSSVNISEKKKQQEKGKLGLACPSNHAIPHNPQAVKKATTTAENRVEFTKATANTLASCREGKCLPDGHLSDVEVVLADVSRRPLRHEFLHAVPVVGHFS